MIEAAVIVLRLLQYAGAAILFGSSLFFIYALPAIGPDSAAATRWARPLVAGSAALLALAALLAIGVQASLFTGSFADGFNASSISAVVDSMDLGKAAILRAATATIAAAYVALRAPSRSSWLVSSGLGAVAAASLAWMGHAAATEGPLGTLCLASDIVHVVAACVWIGALVCFFLLLLTSRHDVQQRGALVGALRRFSGIGAAVVGLIVASGIMNSWVLVGPRHVVELPNTPYGLLLLLKIALFLAMLALAAVNRFRLTPALAEADGKMPGSRALTALRLSIALETVGGFAVLALVAWFGTLAPPSAI